MTPFRTDVLRVVKEIPKGRAMSYGEVARHAGFPGATRAVDTVLRGNFDSHIPCHRVIHADGTIGRYNRGGEKRKAALLKKEGALR